MAQTMLEHMDEVQSRPEFVEAHGIGPLTEDDMLAHDQLALDVVREERANQPVERFAVTKFGGTIMKEAEVQKVMQEEKRDSVTTAGRQG